PGQGSRFFFSVKLKASGHLHNEKPADNRPLQKQKAKGRLLVAEDNLINQKVISAILTDLGYPHDIVENGRLALEAIQKQHYDLILMDGHMPELDGYETTRKIRSGDAGEKTRQIIIIATTAAAILGDKERCFEAGMNDYVSKPISVDDLK